MNLHLTRDRENLFRRNGTGAVNHHRGAGHIQHRGFHAVQRRTASAPRQCARPDRPVHAEPSSGWCARSGLRWALPPEPPPAGSACTPPDAPACECRPAAARPNRIRHRLERGSSRVSGPGQKACIRRSALPRDVVTSSRSMRSSCGGPPHAQSPDPRPAAAWPRRFSPRHPRRVHSPRGRTPSLSAARPSACAQNLRRTIESRTHFRRLELQLRQIEAKSVHRSYSLNCGQGESP